MLNRLFLQIQKITPAKYQWILEHDGFRRYFANTGWMFFGQMFSLLVSFFIGAWLARYLGPENYGVLSYAVAFVGLFAFMADLGAGGILSRELVKFPEKRDELMGTVFRMKLIGGALAMILATGAAIIIDMNPLTRLLIIVFSVSSILQVLNVISIYFQAKVEAKNNVRAQVMATIISSILKVAVILSGKGVIWIIVIFLLDTVWQGLGFLSAYLREGLKISAWRFKSSLARTIWKSSWPLMLASAAGFIYLRIDQVMIGQMFSNYEVGLYAAAVKLVEVWYFIPGIIAASLFPAIVNAKKTGIAVYRQRLKNYYILMAVISVLIALPISLLAHPLVYWLFGVKFLASVPVLQVYIWSSLGLFLGWAVNQYLMAEDRVKTIFVINIFAMIVNIGLNLILIPLFGLTGAAWATLISYLVLPLGAWIAEKRRHKIVNGKKI
ncbi:MAG: flippase [Patescibacteria group bacterium]|nr:flippase [Patescibacteria group bacterium]